MSKLTTFSLTLKEEEKSAREKVVLPFWKKEQQAQSDDKNSKVNEIDEDEENVRINRVSDKNSGKIYYEPDEGDDWDDEDPDDDLDF